MTRHRTSCSISLCAAILSAAFVDQCVATGAGTRFSPFPDAGRVSVAYRISSDKRDATEYDDQYLAGYSGRYPGLKLEMDSSFLEISYGLREGLAVGLLLGQTSAKPNTGGPDDDATSAGVNIRCRPIEHGQFPVDIGVMFQYLASERIYGSDGASAYWEEWGISIDASRRWSQALLYGGLRYSDMTYVYTHESSYGTREGGVDAADNVGVYLGVLYDIVERLALSFEYRFMDTDGYSAALSYSF